MRRPLVKVELLRLEALAVRTAGSRKSREERGSEAFILDILAEVSRRPRAGISRESRLEADLGFDSLMLTELTSALEEAGVPGQAVEELHTVQTVEDLVRLVAGALRRGEGQKQSPRKESGREGKERELKVPAPLASLGRRLLSAGQRALYREFYDTRVSGLANVPHDRNVLVVSNHASHLDMGLVKTALGEEGERLAALAARDYFFDTPLKRAYFENFTNLIPMEREGSLKASLRAAGEALRRGYHLLIFPEGTRSRDGELSRSSPPPATSPSPPAWTSCRSSSPAPSTPSRRAKSSPAVFRSRFTSAPPSPSPACASSRPAPPPREKGTGGPPRRSRPRCAPCDEPPSASGPRDPGPNPPRRRRGRADRSPPPTPPRPPARRSQCGPPRRSREPPRHRRYRLSGERPGPILAGAGHRLRLLQRSPAKEAEALGAEVLRGSVEDPAAVEAALSGVEAVLHLAGQVDFDPRDPVRLYALHVQGTRLLLEAAVKAGVRRVVLASTSGTIAVFEEERTGTEADPYPLKAVASWPYYLSKIYQEKTALRIAKDQGLELVVMNPSLLLGPGDTRLSSTDVVWKFLERRVPAMPGGGLSFVDVRDAAKAFAAALERGRPGQRYLLGGANLSFRDFFGRLERIWASPRPGSPCHPGSTSPGCACSRNLQLARHRAAHRHPLGRDGRAVLVLRLQPCPLGARLRPPRSAGDPHRNRALSPGSLRGGTPQDRFRARPARPSWGLLLT